MDDSQREYYLREQLKVISSQLNNGVSPEEEIQEFRDKIAALPVDDASKESFCASATGRATRFSRPRRR